MPVYLNLSVGRVFRMNILTAMYTMRRGGAYDRFRMMLDALLERGCEVHCLSITPIQINDRRYQNHVLRIPAKMRETFVAQVIVLFLFPVYALWIGRQEKIDLFIAFGALYAFIEGIPKRILKKPMVTFLRGSSAFGMRAQGRSAVVLWLNQWIEKIGIQFSDTILSVNSTIQQEMRRLAGSRKGQRWEILPNNIPSMPILENQDVSEMRKGYGIPEGAKVLLTAGVITRGKNLELLIRCLSEIGLENLFLLVAGDSATEADFQYHTSLMELIKSLGLCDRVIFTGWLEKDHLWKIFHGTDVFILPSLSEGMPNVMLEALGCDLPCMGSRVPGIEQTLIYDELLFDPLDEKKLANKLGRVFSDYRLFSQMKRLCQERKTIFVFDWKEEVFKMAVEEVQSNRE